VLHVVGSGAILASLLFVLGSFGAGYVAGLGSEALEDVGALATAQRNTAAGMIIATQNFSDRPMVMVMITIANSLGILMLMGLARLLGRRADDHRGAEPAPAG
jgi:BASS family bile acid:Na+ symporter